MILTEIEKKCFSIPGSEMTNEEYFLKGGDMKPDVAHEYFGERRKYPRFKPDSKIYILHSIFGSVTDISIAGLSYTYYSWKGDSAEPIPDNGTIFSVDEHYLDDIPLDVVSDEVVRCSSPILPQIKKRRVRFSGLTEKQLLKLELFLLAYVDVPEVGGEEQKKYRQIATAENYSAVL